MKTNKTVKKKKWLKARRRVKRLKKQHNYVSKTYKGTDPFYLQQNLIQQAEMEAREKEVKKEIAKAMGLNPREVR
jgi:tellurite resistance protein